MFNSKFKNFWFKLLCYFLLYLVTSLLTFYFFETPFLLETAFAEETSSDTVKKEESPVAENQQKTPNTYSEILWEYRWYLLGTSLVIISSIAFLIYISSGSPTPEPVFMPHVPGQTITDLIAIRPDVCIDPSVSKAMPDILSVDSNFFYPAGTVADPNFIKGFKAGDILYQVYLMPPDTPYPDVSKDFWIDYAQTKFGHVTFQSPTTTFLYTQVAVIPEDSINYTVYHKVDIVKVIPDPGHQSIPKIMVSHLFKDNESGWFQ